MASLRALVVFLLAFIAASLLAAITLLALTDSGAGHSSAGNLTELLSRTMPALVLLIIVSVFLPALMALALLHARGWLRWRHFATAGGIIGVCFGALYAPVLPASSMGGMAMLRVLWAFLIGGAAGGTAYWLVTFKLFGKGEAQW